MRTMLFGALVLASLAVEAPVSAQEVQITGPLANADACRQCRIYRAGRLQLQPFIGFTLQDEFSRTIAVGGQLNYHLTDWLAIGAWGAFGLIHIDTGLTDEVVGRGQSTSRNAFSLPSRDGFDEQIGQIQWMVAGQLTFIPLRGKLALFQAVFVDADFYIFGGAAAIGLEERADTDLATCAEQGLGRTDCLLESQLARTSRVAIAPTVGLGLMLYANSWIGVSIEWRFLPFAWNTSGTDERGRDPDGEFPDEVLNDEDRLFHVNHMVNFGAAFYLPTAVDTSD